MATPAADKSALAMSDFCSSAAIAAIERNLTATERIAPEDLRTVSAVTAFCVGVVGGSPKRQVLVDTRHYVVRVDASAHTVLDADVLRRVATLNAHTPTEPIISVEFDVYDGTADLVVKIMCAAACYSLPMDMSLGASVYSGPGGSGGAPSFPRPTGVSPLPMDEGAYAIGTPPQMEGGEAPKGISRWYSTEPARLSPAVDEDGHADEAQGNPLDCLWKYGHGGCIDAAEQSPAGGAPPWWVNLDEDRVIAARETLAAPEMRVSEEDRSAVAAALVLAQTLTCGQRVPGGASGRVFQGPEPTAELNEKCTFDTTVTPARTWYQVTAAAETFTLSYRDVRAAHAAYVSGCPIASVRIHRDLESGGAEVVVDVARLQFNPGTSRRCEVPPALGAHAKSPAFLQCHSCMQIPPSRQIGAYPNARVTMRAPPHGYVAQTFALPATTRHAGKLLPPIGNAQARVGAKHRAPGRHAPY